MLGDAELYLRGARTLVASWEEYARGCVGARLERFDGGAAAVFPSGAERDVYNNALLDRELGAGLRGAAIDAIEVAYGDAGIERFAVWVHESDQGSIEDLEMRGFQVDESNRAMGMALEDLRPRSANCDVEAVRAELGENLAVNGMPPEFLAGADAAAFDSAVGRLDGESVATALAYDHDGDRGIYNVETLEHARRRGFGTVVTTRLLEGARSAGCLTASVQSSEMAERMFVGIGFRDLGRFLEYVPEGTN